MTTTSTTEISHTLKVGDVLVANWGYDQVNIDFFAVTRVLPKSVTIVKIKGQVVGNHGEPSEQVMPVLGSVDEYEPKPVTRRVRMTTMGPAVKIFSFASAYLWSGNPQWQTGAAYGH